MAISWKHTKQKLEKVKEESALAKPKVKFTDLKSLDELLTLDDPWAENPQEPIPTFSNETGQQSGVDYSPPINGQVLEWVAFDKKGDYESSEDEDTAAVTDKDGNESEQVTRKRVETLAEANVVTSLIKGTDVPGSKYTGLHNPIIDIDVPVHLVPSTTPGHGHLYFEKPMTWPQFKKLLAVMVEVGLVEPGYLGASDNRGHTCVRLPGLKK